MRKQSQSYIIVSHSLRIAASASASAASHQFDIINFNAIINCYHQKRNDQRKHLKGINGVKHNIVSCCVTILCRTSHMWWGCGWVKAIFDDIMCTVKEMGGGREIAKKSFNIIKTEKVFFLLTTYPYNCHTVDQYHFLFRQSLSPALFTRYKYKGLFTRSEWMRNCNLTPDNTDWWLQISGIINLKGSDIHRKCELALEDRHRPHSFCYQNRPHLVPVLQQRHTPQPYVISLQSPRLRRISPLKLLWQIAVKREISQLFRQTLRNELEQRFLQFKGECCLSRIIPLWTAETSNTITRNFKYLFSALIPSCQTKFNFSKDINCISA